MFCFGFVTLFPELFPGPLGVSVFRRSYDSGLWDYKLANPRDFSKGSNNRVDDAPYGGGHGMVMRVDYLAKAIDSLLDDELYCDLPRFVMSPSGSLFDQSKAEKLASGSGAILISARYEGFDHRLLAARNVEELSIGDYILAGGDVAMMAVSEAVLRLRPGVIGNELSHQEESLQDGLLEYPQYTRPEIFENHSVCSVLLSGNHEKIKQWRHGERLKKTRLNRS